MPLFPRCISYTSLACLDLVIRLTNLDKIKQTFQANKGSPYGPAMTSVIGDYDERMVMVKRKRYVLTPRKHAPVISELSLPPIKPANTKSSPYHYSLIPPLDRTSLVLLTSLSVPTP